MSIVAILPTSLSLDQIKARFLEAKAARYSTDYADHPQYGLEYPRTEGTFQYWANQLRCRGITPCMDYRTQTIEATGRSINPSNENTEQ